MATFLDRLRCEPTSDFATDGGPIACQELERWFNLYAAGVITNTQFKAFFSMTTAQGTQLDAILATQPSTLLGLSLLNAKAVSQWPNKCASICEMAQMALGGLTTDAATKAALGI